jgi:hypothetical protein
VAAIVEGNDSLYLTADSKDGSLTLPSANRIGSRDDASSLIGKLVALGIDAHLGFLFSVYDDVETGIAHIVYRGEARSVDKNMAHRTFTPFDSIPWDRICDKAEQTMLKRYVQEREADAFGIYVGDARAGKVNTLAP